MELKTAKCAAVGAEHVAAAQEVLLEPSLFKKDFPNREVEGHCLGADAGQMGSGSVLDQTFDCTKVSAVPLFLLRVRQR